MSNKTEASTTPASKVRASKETVKKALKILSETDFVGAPYVRAVLDAAAKKLPSDAAYERDSKRTRTKGRHPARVD